ncbi:MAG: DNA polymerase III subunit alpha [Rubrobacter sp.]|nr:DNA polymerase III subunit alpha [Rubrobacter sp.]
MTEGSPREFVHLHVRSGFSYGYGTATPEELVAAAANLGMDSVAITDRDGMYGIPRFLLAAEEHGVSSVVGAEVSVEGGGHVVLLAEDMEGYRSLCGLITEYRCGSEDRRRPLCPLNSIAERSRGLVCLTGALPFGLIPRLILAGERQKALAALGILHEAFGPDGLYIELTDDKTVGCRRRTRQVALFAEEQGIPELATNDIAYLRPGDHRLHEVLVASANLTRLPGPEYRPTDQLYLKPAEKMQKLFEDYPQALKNAALVARRCAGAVQLTGEVRVPTARFPGDEPPEERLARLVLAGARKRYGKPDSRVLGRIDREIACIEKQGYAPYFLIAREAVGIAAERGVPVTGRGSAANSVVAYCLGVTRPEPLSNSLLFERFMHEGRTDCPDIDLDFCSEGRDGVRDELMRRYQRYGVAVAATVQTFSLRGAVRVAARALGHSPRQTNELSRHVPVRFRDREHVFNPVHGWEQALREPAMRGHPLQDRDRHRLLMDLAWGLAGRCQGAGTHNGGMVFGNEHHHLASLVPLEPSGKPGLLRCQYDKDDLEYVGLPKLDLLGLKMHTALKKAGEIATQRLGQRVDPHDPPPEDGATYRLIRSGKNVGMFQLESPGQMHLSRRLLPRRFPDLIAQISLFRPGPVRGNLVVPYVKRRNGLEPYSVILKELEAVLKPTYGILVYQEQVLEIARVVAGFSLAEGDAVRRAMTRDRGFGAMGRIRGAFLRRAVGRGVPRETAEEILSWMEGFSVYGFPKAHAAAFAEISYASAYMRRHYPAEFFCGILNSQPMGFYSPRAVLNEARRIRIEVLPPDIHLSGEGFTVEDDGRAIRVGLVYSKGLSRTAMHSILSERKKPFSSVADLYRRTRVERDSLLNLIRGGFLDALDPERPNRAGLLRDTRGLPKKRSGDHQPEIPIPHPASWWISREGENVGDLPPTSGERERMEWGALSLNVSHHPLAPHRAALRKLSVTSSEEMLTLLHGTRTRAAGLLECLQRPPTKSGKPVWFLLIEDEAGLLQATIFENVYERYGWLLHHRGSYLLEGTVEQTVDHGFSFLVRGIGDLGEMLAGARVPVPEARQAPGSFLRAGRRGRRAG